MRKTRLKKILILSLISLCVLNTYAAGLFGKRSQELNPDYSRSVWDILMQEQSVNDVRKGMYLMAASKYEDAVNAFAKAVTKNPKDPAPYILLGMSLYWTGHVDDAIRNYNAALKLDKNYAEAYQLLGIAYGWKGDITKATKNFEKADSLMQRSDVKMNLSSAYAAQKRFDDAIDYARQAVNLAPRDPLYHHQLGVLSESMGRDTQAEDSFKKAIKLFPGYEDAMLALAATYEKRAENEDALKYYKKAVRVKPGDFVARLRYANLLYLTGDKKEAQKVIEKAFAITASKGKGLALNLAYSSVQNNTGAAQNQQTQNKISPQLENLKNSLSRFSAGDNIEIETEVTFQPKTEFKKTGEKTLLEKEFEEAKQRESSKAFRRSFILSNSSEEERAAQIETIVNALQQALDNAPQGQETKLNIKTDVLPSTVSSAAAGESAQKTAYNPRTVGNDMGLWVTGRSWMRFVEEALSDISVRIFDNPDENFDYILLGLAYLTSGQGPQAYNAFETAQDKGAGQELSLMGKGTALIIMGKEDEAKEIYKQVLELNPKNKTAKNNLSFLTK